MYVCVAGVVLHFNLPIIKDYYIVNPQRWFDLCALVISPNNVSSLVRFGRPGGKLSELNSTYLCISVLLVRTYLTRAKP